MVENNETPKQFISSHESELHCFAPTYLKKNLCVCDYSEDKSPLKRHGQKMFLPVAGPPHKSQRPQRCDWSIPIPTQQHIQDVYIYSNPLYKTTKETGIGL